MGKKKKEKAIFHARREFILHYELPHTSEEIIDFLSVAVPLAIPARKTPRVSSVTIIAPAPNTAATSIF